MNAVPPKTRVRALVIDDSAYNRATIAQILEESQEVEVVGRAADGEEGLRLALELKPDVITLDLEMPRMDGFTFLRILMERQPTPVIIISSYSRKQNVFKALELGALDFIAKPTHHISPELSEIASELLSKVLMVRQLSFGVGRRPLAIDGAPGTTPAGAAGRALQTGLVAIGASTGGPPALQRLFQSLPRGLPLSYLVAQHMPEKFTQAFAERLARYTGLPVKEAEDGEEALPGRAYIAPGGRNLRLRWSADRLVLEVRPAPERAKYVPSIDELFSCAAEALGERTLAILLTGMGSDGCLGMRRVRERGGRTVAESQETAVIFGMPREAIDAGLVDRVLRLDEIPSEVERFSKKIQNGSQS
ncbi:MAG: chemotaxis response regulator protein-glutamate methylesterase [Myxococcales bacterium]|nr:chemotaxis response regulator protein-glutamate methylesterase [Myxococcales bacterium]